MQTTSFSTWTLVTVSIFNDDDVCVCVCVCVCVNNHDDLINQFV